MWASLTSAEKMIAGAAVVTFVAAFLPWASVLGISVNGVDADGKITLVIALIGLIGFAVLAFGRGRRAGRIGQIVLGALTAIVGVADLHSISAFGLYLTLIAGILWAVAAVAALRGSPARASREQADRSPVLPTSRTCRSLGARSALRVVAPFWQAPPGSARTGQCPSCQGRPDCAGRGGVGGPAPMPVRRPPAGRGPTVGCPPIERSTRRTAAAPSPASCCVRRALRPAGAPKRRDAGASQVGQSTGSPARSAGARCSKGPQSGQRWS